MEEVFPVDEICELTSYRKAVEIAEEWASEESGGPNAAVEDMLLSEGVLPGEDPELEENLLIALDQPDFDQDS